MPPTGSPRVWVQEPSPAPTSPVLPPEVTTAIADPRVASAYGADMGVPLKAPPRPIRGEFNAFVEGGAFWTGGDPVRTFPFSVADPLAPNSAPFNLNPRLGWDAAVGFDYRFAGSPWHVSAQFRYGAASKSDSDASGFGPAVIFAAFPGGFFNTTAAAQTTASNREAHWLADFAIGRDLNSGSDAIQVKFGMRVAELSSRIHQVNNTSLHATQFPFIPGGGFFDQVTNRDIEQNASFRGAGPRIAAEGAVPLPAGWEFDYLAGAAVLFGTRRFDLTNRFVDIQNSNLLVTLPFASRFTQVDQKGATVANGDLQAGFAYWVTPNFRVNASYRLDAYFRGSEHARCCRKPTDRRPLFPWSAYRRLGALLIPPHADAMAAPRSGISGAIARRLHRNTMKRAAAASVMKAPRRQGACCHRSATASQKCPRVSRSPCALSLSPRAFAASALACWPERTLESAPQS
jgi:hypothetical protein